MPDLMTHFGLAQNATGYLTSAVQFGFIIGTLIFALLSIADRYAPAKVFFICALAGAACNLGVIWEGNTYTSLLSFRFFTGFFLAGIYPVGMKIASDYYEKGLGKSLGFLVGALVVGTAFPHLLREVKGELSWTFVLIATSSLATLGGILMVILVPNGPFRKASQKVNLFAISGIFKSKSFRTAALGYFGHMWELYAFWAFVPVMLQIYLNLHSGTSFNIPLLSFFIIGIGGVACVVGGYIAQRVGVKKVAFTALLLSCLCCLISPLLFIQSSHILFMGFLLFWGIVVIADSPLFSTLVAQTAPPALKGTALTIVNSIGFFLTIFSIQLLQELHLWTQSPAILTALAIGPVLGYIAGLTQKEPRQAP